MSRTPHHQPSLGMLAEDQKEFDKQIAGVWCPQEGDATPIRRDTLDKMAAKGMLMAADHWREQAKTTRATSGFVAVFAGSEAVHVPTLLAQGLCLTAAEAYWRARAEFPNRDLDCILEVTYREHRYVTVDPNRAPVRLGTRPTELDKLTARYRSEGDPR
jgi:hypothetical protein